MHGAYSDARAAVDDDARAEWDAMSEEERAKWKVDGKGAYDHYLRNRIAAEMSARQRTG